MVDFLNRVLKIGPPRSPLEDRDSRFGWRNESGIGEEIETGRNRGRQLLPENLNLPNLLSPFFTANLTFNTTEEDLLRIFGRFGKIRDVFMSWNRQLNRPRGFAFIRFCYEQDVIQAIHCLHERRIDGRVAHIAWVKKKLDNQVAMPSPSYPEYQTKKPQMAQSFLDATTRSKPVAKTVTEEVLRVTTTADSKAVENRLRWLNLAMVGTAVDRDVRLDRLIGSLKNPNLKLSDTEIIRITATKFLILFKSESEIDAFKRNAALQKEMGLQSIEKWSPEEAFTRIKVIPRPGVSFNQVLRLRVLEKEHPIITEMESLFKCGSSSSIQQSSNESTEHWVLRRVHGNTGPPLVVYENVSIRAKDTSNRILSKQLGDCNYTNIGDGVKAYLGTGGVLSTPEDVMPVTVFCEKETVGGRDITGVCENVTLKKNDNIGDIV
ncbi:uncharacterized protein LOC131217595 [Magnolia sinica]|uniref:uncharacterized protein LOC131217595 n=1 Tax=Magnolia sinica TaxID=86752 RepID=UPI00265A6BC0|nr:uncharacterized protein LOC131217595 [Magnolia sinica]